MRLTMCALSAVLLSGCSWLGMGGSSSHYGASGSYGACAPGYGHTASYGQVNCGPNGGYSVAHGQHKGHYGHQGHGAGYSAQYASAGGAYGAGYGLRGSSGVGYQGAYGVPGQVGVTVGGMGAYGNGTVTTLGGAAPYGAAVSGMNSVYGQNVVGASYAGGQWGQAVRTVQGAPIYVPQPYGVPYGVGVGGGAAAVGAALPFGLAALGGTDFDIDGDLFGGKPSSPNNPDMSLATGEVDTPPLSYDDAFDNGYRIGGALERDLNRNTTLLAQGYYNRQNGKTFNNGTFTPGSYDANGNFTPSGPAETVTGEMGNLNAYTLEAGLRKYMGGPVGMRPYVGATAGATYNESVDITQQIGNGAPFTQEFIESGWNPTASGVIGAEMAVGHRGAIGVETGLRWTDGYDTVSGGSDDRLSIPLTVRGRVAF